MCYFRTKTLYRPGTHDQIEYYIEWDESLLQQDISCSQDLFTVTVSEENGKKRELAKAKTVAEAQRIIDKIHGNEIPKSVWIQYCCSMNHGNKRYVIYETWDSVSGKYMVAVSRDDCPKTYKYIEVSEETAWDALHVTGANLPSEILDIAKEDIRSGILDQYITDYESFQINEYITDGTQPLLQEMWQSQGSKKTFPMLLFLFMKALVSDDGTSALPDKFSAPGEISQCLRGTCQGKNYEINTRLRYDQGIWRFAGESLHVNGKNLVLTSRNADGSYSVQFMNKDYGVIPIPFNQSQVKGHLPNSFIKMAKAFLEKYSSVH